MTWEKSFFEKSYSKCVGETIPRPFSKISKMSIPLDQYSLKFYTVCLILYAKLRAIEIYWN